MLDLRTTSPQALRVQLAGTDGQRVIATLNVTVLVTSLCPVGVDCVAGADVINVLTVDKKDARTNQAPGLHAVAGTPVRIPVTWAIRQVGAGEWSFSPDGSDKSIQLTRLPEQIPFDEERGVIDSYPGAHAIAYGDGNGAKVWRVESGAGESRQTTIGIDYLGETYELTFRWGADSAELADIISEVRAIAEDVVK